MFLKIMHDGANEFLSQAQSEATYSIYGDVVSCHFSRCLPGPEGVGTPVVFGQAHIWCREPVKTADVPGYAEIEKHVQLTGDAFVMNDQGRTISKFIAEPFGRPEREARTIGSAQAAEPSDEERAAKLFEQLPWSVAATMRKVAMTSDSIGATDLLRLLDKARVAVDA